MASTAWWAYGSTLATDGTDIAEIIDISGPSMSKDAIEVTAHDGSDGYREYIPGWRDGGEVSITANWLPSDATQADLLAVFEGDALRDFTITTAGDGSASTIDIDFSGIVTSFNAAMPLEEQGKLDFTLKISGAVVFS